MTWTIWVMYACGYQVEVKLDLDKAEMHLVLF